MFHIIFTRPTRLSHRESQDLLEGTQGSPRGKALQHEHVVFILFALKGLKPLDFI